MNYTIFILIKVSNVHLYQYKLVQNYNLVDVRTGTGTGTGQENGRLKKQKLMEARFEHTSEDRLTKIKKFTYTVGTRHFFPKLLIIFVSPISGFGEMPTKEHH